ncbi:MAG: DUF465 domain-containing protein [Deltaproteobacteria bacterium]|nr:DUF465 domain-containing protein [Deltaproteobacteria bacterium]
MGEIDELKRRLLEEDVEFRRAYDAHRDYERLVEELNRKRYLTTEEEMEKKRLQKLKLAQKDMMEEIVSKYRC